MFKQKKKTQINLLQISSLQGLYFERNWGIESNGVLLINSNAWIKV